MTKIVIALFYVGTWVSIIAGDPTRALLSLSLVVAYLAIHEMDQTIRLLNESLTAKAEDGGVEVEEIMTPSDIEVIELAASDLPVRWPTEASRVHNIAERAKRRLVAVEVPAAQQPRWANLPPGTLVEVAEGQSLESAVEDYLKKDMEAAVADGVVSVCKKLVQGNGR